MESSGSEEAGEDWYDSELRFLRVLERDVTRSAHRAATARAREQAHAARAQAHAARSHSGARSHASDARTHEGRRRRDTPDLRPRGMRMARRSLTLLALLSLIGASAFGAGEIFSAGPANPANVSQSALVSVAIGVAGSDHWTLRVYTRGAELCRVLVVTGEAESSRCSTPPPAEGVGVTSVLSPTHRYVFGVTGALVTNVNLSPTLGQGESLRTPTHALTAQPFARLHAGKRWFLAIAHRPVGEPDPPLRVEGLGRDGRRVGPALVDCAETADVQSCPR
ncbi:MAG TPA: hypothetical protein VGI26_03525 [Solirubrobacteraceae bacterium]